MNQILVKCKNCGKIFPSGIAMAPGSSATFINNKSICRFCGSMENIPDGTFKSTVEGFIQVLKETDNPLKQAQDLFNDLQQSKTREDLSKLKKSQKFSKFKKWLPDSPEKIAAYIAIIYALIQLLTKTPEINHIEYNNFVTEYNQTLDIEIKVENKLTSNNNEYLVLEN